ncbi:MAG: hypothetical protein K1X83_05190 [Oligoflexia bacterium]|nr:hypothetical protein [Oligoflexia bacterium]
MAELGPAIAKVFLHSPRALAIRNVALDELREAHDENPRVLSQFFEGSRAARERVFEALSTVLDSTISLATLERVYRPKPSGTPDPAYLHAALSSLPPAAVADKPALGRDAVLWTLVHFAAGAENRGYDEWESDPRFKKYVAYLPELGIDSAQFLWALKTAFEIRPYQLSALAVMDVYELRINSESPPTAAEVDDILTLHLGPPINFPQARAIGMSITAQTQNAPITLPLLPEAEGCDQVYRSVRDLYWRHPELHDTAAQKFFLAIKDYSMHFESLRIGRPFNIRDWDRADFYIERRMLWNLLRPLPPEEIYASAGLGVDALKFVLLNYPSPTFLSHPAGMPRASQPKEYKTILRFLKTNHSLDVDNFERAAFNSWAASDSRSLRVVEMNYELLRTIRGFASSKKLMQELLTLCGRSDLDPSDFSFVPDLPAHHGANGMSSTWLDRYSEPFERVNAKGEKQQVKSYSYIFLDGPGFVLTYKGQPLFAMSLLVQHDRQLMLLQRQGINEWLFKADYQPTTKDREPLYCEALEIRTRRGPHELAKSMCLDLAVALHEVLREKVGANSGEMTALRAIGSSLLTWAFRLKDNGHAWLDLEEAVRKYDRVWAALGFTPEADGSWRVAITDSLYAEHLNGRLKKLTAAVKLCLAKHKH